MVGKFGTLVALSLIGPPAAPGRLHPPEPGAGRIPTPLPRVEPVLTDFVAQSLARHRELLAVMERGRAQYEQWQRDGDPRFDAATLEWAKQKESECRSRLRELERGRLPHRTSPP